MSQQWMGFEENNSDGPKSSPIFSYEKVPHYEDYASYGEKLSGQGKVPTMGQRLALAIISLVLLMAMLFVVVGLAFSGMSLSPDVARNFVSVFAIALLAFLITIIVMNRVRAARQRLVLAIVSVVLLMVMFFVLVGLVFSGLFSGMFAITFLAFMAAIVLINTVFNLRR
jgi:hypothetical protein